MNENDKAAAQTSLDNFSTHYPIERVQWIDSNGRSRWEDTQVYVEYAKAANLRCESVGYVVLETDDRLALVQNLAPNSMDNMMVIPKVAIQLRTRLNDE